MNLTVTTAQADLTEQLVSRAVLEAYQMDHLAFGPEYVVPKPFEPRVCLWQALAVTNAAIESGVTRLQINLDPYVRGLETRLMKTASPDYATA